jgi:ADP-ribose pyrophosphatase YjhB (NUDIX family)
MKTPTTLIPPQSLPDPRPHLTVGALLIDDQDRTLIMHRSNKVRSAKDCWSLPTGLLDHGESIETAIAREVEEELGLRVKQIGAMTTVGENQPGDGFHWVLIYRVAYVDDVSRYVNAEPDKHDKIRTMKLSELRNAIMKKSLKFSPGLEAPVYKLLLACI